MIPQLIAKAAKSTTASATIAALNAIMAFIPSEETPVASPAHQTVVSVTQIQTAPFATPTTLSTWMETTRSALLALMRHTRI